MTEMGFHDQNLAPTRVQSAGVFRGNQGMINTIVKQHHNKNGGKERKTLLAACHSHKRDKQRRETGESVASVVVRAIVRESSEEERSQRCSEANREEKPDIERHRYQHQ